jgi:hypothetical protein
MKLNYPDDAVSTPTVSAVTSYLAKCWGNPFALHELYADPVLSTI